MLKYFSTGCVFKHIHYERTHADCCNNQLCVFSTFDTPFIGYLFASLRCFPVLYSFIASIMTGTSVLGLQAFEGHSAPKSS